jgi:hypothetical protein
MRTSMLLLFLLGACAGDEVDPSNDCTKVLYDTCASEHDCTTDASCRFFTDGDFAACTQMCDAGTPCPDGPDGTPATCNAQNICQPAAPKMCRLAPEPQP